MTLDAHTRTRLPDLAQLGKEYDSTGSLLYFSPSLMNNKRVLIFENKSTTKIRRNLMFPAAPLWSLVVPCVGYQGSLRISLGKFREAKAQSSTIVKKNGPLEA